MSGSQHNPNGRPAQLGSSWSPLQLQMANLLARAPQAHMASERGVTWHTPTPPPHLYHVPQPSPPDPLQAMKGAGNSVFRHTATPPELYRHTPTPPDKHLHRHTPSPGDVKAGSALPPVDLYAHLGPGREKLNRNADIVYGRGVDLSVSRAANGASLSVRDAPTINSLIARAPRHHRVDELLERLAPAAPIAPAAPHSVIVTARAAPTPSPPSSNEDSADSTGAPKRKRKPERTVRVPALPLPAPAPPPPPPREPQANGGPDVRGAGAGACAGPEARARAPEPPVRRKTRSGSAETIDDIAAMIASTEQKVEEPAPKEAEKPTEPPVTIAKLKSVLASDPEPATTRDDCPKSPPPPVEEKPEPAPAPAPEPLAEAAAPRRRAARASTSSPTNVPIESPSEAKPAEPAEPARPGAEPSAASFVEVENQLEKMFAGIEEAPVNQEAKPAEPTESSQPSAEPSAEVENQLEKIMIEEAPVNQKGDQPAEKEKPQTSKARKRRKSLPGKGERKAARRAGRAATTEDKGKRKGQPKRPKDAPRDAYDSGSNASSGRSRGPYIQIRGPRDSPLSVAVMNAGCGEEEGDAASRRADFRNGLRARGLHCSTLGLRYDATTPDATWLCAFCERGPHAAGLGDLFGPYPLQTDCPEYSALDSATRQKYEADSAAWVHEACAVWAPGLLAAGARLWGLASAVWSCRGARCAECARGGAGLACARRACRARVHVPCARAACWAMHEDDFRALCPRHADPS